jgi:hypothetical protein
MFLACRGLEIDTPESAVFSIFSAMVSASPSLHTCCLIEVGKMLKTQLAVIDEVVH